MLAPHGRQHGDVGVGVVMDLDGRPAGYVRRIRPTYWTMLPLNDTGWARIRVSSREQS
jgi:hypothetical protein